MGIDTVVLSMHGMDVIAVEAVASPYVGYIYLSVWLVACNITPTQIRQLFYGSVVFVYVVHLCFED